MKLAVGATIHKPPVLWVYSLQCVFLLVMAIGVYVLDRAAGLSMLIGGALCVGPSAYFARFAFRYRGARAARQVASAFYRGETGKFLLSAVGFGVTFLLYPTVNAPLLFSSFAAFVVLNGLLSARFLVNRQ